ncbi:hypothetical protein [Dietzia sp. 179-F 9C3 NHS]|uniref:hypothetical protein n=1 Tax=Dietzia sp. 179-F 9C3 NHS TaxID=3374295 RepID=UPI00387920D9
MAQREQTVEAAVEAPADRWSQDAGALPGAPLVVGPDDARAQARRIADAGERARQRADVLAAALEAAATAASGLACGPALAECAVLLARRARDLAGDTAAIAEGIDRALATLGRADEEVARRVAGAAG